MSRKRRKHISKAYHSKELPKRPPLKTGKTGLLVGLLIVVCIIVSAVHWPALSAEALFFDDDLYLTDNKLVQSPSLASARQFLIEVLEPSTVHGYYQPLTMISLMLDHALGGRADNLMPFHRTSLALHVMNTALVITLLYLLFGHAWAAAAVGLLFGLHPMTVETIPWVGERKTLLSGFFALWCLILYVRLARKSNWSLYVGCMVTYVLAVMSKPISVPLPVLMLLMDYWPLRRLKWQCVSEKIPFFVVAGIFAVITIISQGRTAAVTMPGKYGPGRIALTLCHNIIFYPYKMVWPVNMSSYYTFPEPLDFSNPMVLAGVIGTCVLIPLLVISLRWTRVVLTGWLIFFVAIFPTMGVIGFTIVIAADKFAYLPSTGLLMVLTSFLIWFCGASKSPARHLTVVIILLILAFAEATIARRNLVYWRNTADLYEQMLTLTPDVIPMLYNQARALQSQDRTEEAISRYRRILQMDPDYSRAHLNLGVALSSQGKVDEAISHYHRALQLKPDGAETHYSLGAALQTQGKLDEAISHYRQALQVKPDYVDTHFNLGNALNAQGKVDEATRHYQEAIVHYRKGLQFKPDEVKMLASLAKTHNNLANMLSRYGKPEEAIEQFRQALEVRPDYAEAHSNLGWELRRTGQPNAALGHFREALRLEPNLLQPLVGMAQTLATHPDARVRDVNKAIEFAERAAELTRHQDTMVLDTLAATYAAAGQFDRAARTAEAALASARDAQNDELAIQMRRKLELYRQARPGN